MISDWNEVGGVLRNGDLYSVKGFRPGPDDVKRILEVAKNRVIGIGHVGKYVMIFRDGVFWKSGDYFRSPLNPLYASEKMCMLLDLMEDGKEYMREDLRDDFVSYLEISDSGLFRQTLSSCIREGYVEKSGDMYVRSATFF